MEEFTERALAALMTPIPKAVPASDRAVTPLGALLERWMRADSHDRVEMVTKLGVAVYIGAHDLEAALVEQLRSTEA